MIQRARNRSDDDEFGRSEPSKQEDAKPPPGEFGSRSPRQSNHKPNHKPNHKSEPLRSVPPIETESDHTMPKATLESPEITTNPATPKSSAPGKTPKTKGAKGKAAVAEKSGTGVAPLAPGRRQALDRALAQIEKAHGKGSIMTLDGDHLAGIKCVSTGALSLDLALGGRGLPKGRVVEVFGPESSGKTTLALTVAANVQKNGGIAAFIDAEHALDPTWARKLGVNIDIRVEKRIARLAWASLKWAAYPITATTFALVLDLAAIKDL